ncbi:RNA polymerase sigma factor [Flavobacterium orientale]|uniref:DNA-directed RNA polymerase sigma-70 factor n=1 Tax=Flavobacterium orientale TaxID=1756020 RepID=A0A916Y6K0_9FLAO|nr:RNA polymerase sigma factor [Flavobacterium orientale]GGD33229.1 DNA-directed RNA polymerase sigma-70 factor [Flavobacterium orientale]
MNLNEIIAGCVKQKREAQKELYDNFNKILFQSCLKYSGNYEEAEDLLHDAFIDILTSIHTYKFKGSFEGWMKRIVINKAITHFKTKPYTDSIEKTVGLAEEENEMVTYSNSLEDILTSIQELPNQYQMVFSLYELDNYSHKEIASMLSISESTSKSNLHRAKAILRLRLTEKNSTKKVANGI